MYLLIYICILLINTDIDQKKLVSNVLDNLHNYASQANGKLYFDLFHDDAIFFGTDAKERWNKKDFQDYAEERFSNGDGWTYYIITRNIYFDEDKNTAWFDEELNNEKYGVFRGTGVLTKQNNKWRINQYNLLLPIPNELLIQYSKEIKEFLDND